MYKIQGLEINTLQWFRTALGIHGFNGVKGAEQTWFITAILICYAVTPLLDIICGLYNKLTKRKQKAVVICMIILPAMLAFFVAPFAWNFLVPVIWYGLAYLVGNQWTKFSKFISYKTAVASVMIMIGLFIIRIVCRFLIDGTLFYDRIIVGYEHNLAAWCITIVFMFLFRCRKPIHIVDVLSRISFEIYLYHYMFIGGPLSLLGVTGYVVIDMVIIVIVTIGISLFANWIVGVVTNKLGVIKK